jgi:hypothetical protein
MANKITLLKSTDDGYGGTQRRMLYWYVISPRITDAGSNQIIPLTSANVPSDAAVYVNAAADLNALNAGDAGFEVVQRLQTAGETNAAFTIRIRAEQVARETAWVAAQRAAYALAGTAIN